MTTTKKTTAAKPTVKAEPKATKPEPTPEQVKAIKSAHTRLAKVVEQRAALAQQEREVVAELRALDASWQTLADTMGMSAMGVRNRYKDLVPVK